MKLLHEIKREKESPIVDWRVFGDSRTYFTPYTSGTYYNFDINYNDIVNAVNDITLQFRRFTNTATTINTTITNLNLGVTNE